MLCSALRPAQHIKPNKASSRPILESLLVSYQENFSTPLVIKYLFIPKIHADHLLYARHYTRFWGHQGGYCGLAPALTVYIPVVGGTIRRRTIMKTSGDV